VDGMVCSWFTFSFIAFLVCGLGIDKRHNLITNRKAILEYKVTIQEYGYNGPFGYWLSAREPPF